ncbi:unnamed protein product, partial [Didymodactylos carnosus]
DTDVGTNNDCVFKVGDVFNSFNEFKYKLNDYSINTGGMFSIGHSTKLKQTSELVYGKLLYVCCHGGKQRCRSKGIRPQQHHMSLNCPAKIRLFNTGTQLKISILNFHHNHKVDPSNLKYYPRNRRLENETVELIKKFDNHKVPRAIIRDMVMSENKTKFTTVKDIANVLNKVTTNIPSQSIAVQKILNEIKSLDPTATIDINVGENDQLDMIFIATSKMKENLKNFTILYFLMQHTKST